MQDIVGISKMCDLQSQYRLHGAEIKIWKFSVVHWVFPFYLHGHLIRALSLVKLQYILCFRTKSENCSSLKAMSIVCVCSRRDFREGVIYHLSTHLTVKPGCGATSGKECKVVISDCPTYPSNPTSVKSACYLLKVLKAVHSSKFPKAPCSYSITLMGPWFVKFSYYKITREPSPHFLLCSAWTYLP